MRFIPDRTVRRLVAAALARSTQKVRTIHRDERGTISILSVIALLMLTMLLGMILNVGEQIDDKIKMQNAADAATYSSGVVIARGMNTVAFTNHLLSETFALTAYFREGRDRYAETLVPEILDAWVIVGQQLGLSDFQLIRDIQPAIAPRVQMEREIVKAFGDMTAIKSRLLLPPLEKILGIPEMPQGGMPLTADEQRQVALSHLIPTFQRTLVLAIPAAATTVSQEIARRNTPGRNASSAQCVIWTTRTVPVQNFNQSDPFQRLLPGLDPSFEGPDYSYLMPGEANWYQANARTRRDQLAFHYLNEWIDDDNYDLGPFEREGYHQGGRVSAKMSQFINLWRGFTRAKLRQLLTQEFPKTNLPHMLRFPKNAVSEYDWETSEGTHHHSHSESHMQLIQQEYLEDEFTFDTAVYRAQRKPVMPGMYRVPIKGDAFAFARVSVYLPRVRFITSPGCPAFFGRRVNWFGDSSCGTPHYDFWPQEWSLFSQNWAARMIPTSAVTTLSLIQTNPQQAAPGVTLPNVGSIQIQDLKAINFH